MVGDAAPWPYSHRTNNADEWMPWRTQFPTLPNYTRAAGKSYVGVMHPRLVRLQMQRLCYMPCSLTVLQHHYSSGTTGCPRASCILICAACAGVDVGAALRYHSGAITILLPSAYSSNIRLGEHAGHLYAGAPWW